MCRVVCVHDVYFTEHSKNTRLGRPTGGLVLEGGTGWTGLWGNTGALVRSLGTTPPGWMTPLARTLQSAGTGGTELWVSTRDLVHTTRTSPLGSIPTFTRHGRSAGIERTAPSQRPGDTARSAGAGYPGPKRRTGDQTRWAGTTRPGWMPTLAWHSL